MPIHKDKLEVNTRIEFIQFVEKLRLSFLNEPEKWENKNLDDFLEALARYAEDNIQGYYDYTEQIVNADEPSWKVFADILKGASIYE